MGSAVDFKKQRYQAWLINNLVLYCESHFIAEHTFQVFTYSCPFFFSMRRDLCTVRLITARILFFMITFNLLVLPVANYIYNQGKETCFDPSGY